MYNSVKQITSL